MPKLPPSPRSRGEGAGRQVRGDAAAPKFVAGAVRGTAPAVPVAAGDGRATGSEARASDFVPAGEEDSRDG